MNNLSKTAKGKRQKPAVRGAFGLILRAAFTICIFSIFTFAQTTEKKPVENNVVKNASAPKVTQIDETNIAEILKPNGKPLLVNFWATWCVPCREEFPDLVEIDNEFKGKINVITISLDDLAEINRDVPKFLLEMKAEMPTYLLYTNKESEVISSISKDWQGGLPFSILYDGKGEIVHTKQGKINPEIVKQKINNLIYPKVEIFNKTNEDKENKIVAVRQINIIVDDVDSNGRSIKRKIPRIEIELFSKWRPPATSSAHRIAIGDKFFYVGGKGCEEKFGCIMVVLTLEEFESLKDNSLVTYQIGGGINPAILEQADKNGKLEQIVGYYFGRLDKTILDKSSKIERFAVQH